MNFCVLGSGSKGNATYIESGETRILIDAGMSGIELQRRLSTIDVELHEIDAILDKISEKGYESLTKEEKQKLFNASNNKISDL